MNSSLSRRCAAEFIGTGFLVAAVVGSGIMGERLSGGNTAIALLANTLATGAALATLILVFLPISGAHLNPVVSMTEAFRRGITRRDACFYIAAQISGGIVGAACANLMFELPVLSISHHVRTGAPQWFSEFVATFGLLLTIRMCARFAFGQLAFAVAGYIVAAYWFYGVDVVCQSCRHDCALIERHVCGDPAWGRSRIPHRANRRIIRRSCGVRLA